MQMNALFDVCLALDTKNMVTKFNQVCMVSPTGPIGVETTDAQLKKLRL
jgi:hypothetical protein